MRRFDVGDRVRVDLPNESDPDHDAYHGRHGTVAAIIDDDGTFRPGDKAEEYLRE